MQRGILRLLIISVALAAILGLPVNSPAAEPVTRSFTTTGENELVVPAGVDSMQVKLVGGAGSPADGKGPLGGSGAIVTGTIAVNPGETLFAEVGGYYEVTSPDFPVEATNGGGAFGGQYAGAGGGATDVRMCSIDPSNPMDPLVCAGKQTLLTRLLVAGGGGGGGGDSNEPGIHGGAGGNAGSPGAGGDAYEEFDLQGGGGGAAATQSAGGSAGDHSTPDGNQAATGQLGRGGNGGGDESGDFATAGGGGGGGGIFGGGGGGSGESEYGGSPIAGGGGGGGGSSGVPSGVGGVSSVAITTAAHSAVPEALFTWTRPAPSVVGAPARSVSANTATLAGTVNPNGSQITDCHFAVSPAPTVGATFPCVQQIGSGSEPVAVSANLTDLAPSTNYTVILNATSAQGSSTGSAVVFTTASSTSSNAGTANNVDGVGSGGSASSGAKLTVTDLKLSPTHFRLGKHAASISKTKSKPKSVPTSTTISFNLSQAASVTLTFEEALPGILVGKHCTKPTKAHRKGKKCGRYTTVAHDVTLSAQAGAERIHFEGVLDGGAHLKPGSYRLSLSASDSTGKLTASEHPTFTLLG